MYIDARKFDYTVFGYPDAAEREARDKAFAKKNYQEWFDNCIDDMINRQWEIEDIGVVERTGDFVRLLREAEFTYSIGAYTSTLALVGVSAEDLSKFLIEGAGQKDKYKDQASRIDALHELGIIVKSSRDLLHTVRKLRNDCLHFNQSFKAKDDKALRQEALTALNALKRMYASVVGAVDYRTVDSEKFGSLLKALADQSSSNQHPTGIVGHDAIQSRLRNLFASAFGIDISLDDPHRVMERMSLFRVEEVDPDWTPPEITLVDQLSGYPVIVDLDDRDLEQLRSIDVGEGDIIAASLRSVPDDLGMTSTWRLASEVQKV